MTSSRDHAPLTLVLFQVGGLTKQLQPANKCWNKPFKEAYRILYDEWMATGEKKTYTPAGNVCPPTKLQVVQWVKLAWEAVSKDIIHKSFRMCGITVKPDGSEDSEISFLKEEEVARDTRCEIELRTAALEQGEQVDSGDPFANEENEDELEENEIVVNDDLGN